MPDKDSQKIKKELEEIVQRERNRLELLVASLDAQIKEINERINQIPLWEKKLAEIKEEIRRLSLLKKERIACQKEVYLLEREIKNLMKANSEIEKEGKTLAAKIELLNKTQSICPICERKLPNPYKGMLLGELKRRYYQQRESYQANLKTVKSNRQKIASLKDKIREIDIILLGKKEMQDQKKKIIQEIEVTKKDSRKLNQLYEQHRYLKDQLTKRAFAPLSQKMLKEMGKGEDLL